MFACIIDKEQFQEENMTARIIDGKLIGEELRKEVADGVQQRVNAGNHARVWQLCWLERIPLRRYM